MNKVDNYDLSLNLLDKAHQSLAHTIADLELLREGTAFNQILNDGAHIIEPDELTHILDKFINLQSSIQIGRFVSKLTTDRLVRNLRWIMFSMKVWEI